MLGHVNSAADGPSVFFGLGTLRPGDRIQIDRADHTTATFTVDSVISYPKDAFPTHAVYGDTDYPALRLITCRGPFDHHTERQVPTLPSVVPPCVPPRVAPATGRRSPVLCVLEAANGLRGALVVAGGSGAGPGDLARWSWWHRPVGS